ncbi:hypothetical protein [Pseudomonas syringae]|uniref:hypothetical protein n=1 Tax=Pseudomonas syringae TaxID=317 RepID=UPI000CD32ADE|nr:hypothetical protein [Pseudomonas syringae]MCF4987427.1 hypothetical protein [Pseudomonas syringae]MCF5201015.1 hypothetical protein [Pseudomonas syringae]MCF5202846.1 hypothetical protein [Pseudomonas syringae]MCF5209422.1 hypothetical protein [Pseudomonas syringae]MCF5212497.1 hypothetical protein [Pseudomonas syringae]
MDTTLKIAMLVKEGKQRIISSGDWLTVAELSELTAQPYDELEAEVYSSMSERRIFAISYKGVDYFPTYAFDANDGYQPVPAFKPVIEILATRKDAWGMAFWFSSSNSYLGGRQPKEVIRTELVTVLDAASDEVCGILHG